MDHIPEHRNTNKHPAFDHICPPEVWARLPWWVQLHLVWVVTYYVVLPQTIYRIGLQLGGIRTSLSN
jgi:hypothetical protein